MDLATLRGCMYRLADTQSRVPKNSQELGNPFARRRLHWAIDQQEQIDVGKRKQFPPSITADGDNRDQWARALECVKDQSVHFRATFDQDAGGRLQDSHSVSK